MIRLGNILWWTLYLIVGISVQRLFPGVDALLPGLIISCQEGKKVQTCCLILVAMLIQEGTSSLMFGASFLWYGTFLVLFMLGRLFFVPGSLFFIVLLVFAMGIAGAAILNIISGLQGFHVAFPTLVRQALTQSLLALPLYMLSSWTRKRLFNHEYGI